MRPNTKVYVGLIGLGLLAMGMASSASAGMYCEDQYHNRIQAVSSSHVPGLEALRAEIKRIQDAGLDPSKYLVEFEGQHVPMTYKFAVLFDRYQSAANGAAGKAQGCAAAVAPAQLAANIGVVWATGGLSLLLPERMTRIDVGEILHGKPLGGDNALIPKAREDLLRAITGREHDNGEISKIIRDPIKCTVGRLFGEC